MDARGNGPKLLELFEVIEEHPSAIARDCRELLGFSVMEIGGSVRYDEAILLLSTLMRDPRSWVQAEIAGWEHPVSWEWITAVDLYDLQHSSKSKKKIKPYPRPWPDENKSRMGGDRKVRRTAEEVMAILRPQQ